MGGRKWGGEEAVAGAGWMGEGLGVNDGRELTESEWLRLLPGRLLQLLLPLLK